MLDKSKRFIILFIVSVTIIILFSVFKPYFADRGYTNKGAVNTMALIVLFTLMTASVIYQFTRDFVVRKEEEVSKVSKKRKK